MPKKRKARCKPRPNGRPRRLGPTAKPQPSPSPAVAGVAQGSPQAVIASIVPPDPQNEGARMIPSGKAGTPSWYLPPDSKVRSVALSIMALRAAGKSDEEIAVELKISPKSVSPYVYRAAKNGWLVADSPMDRVKYELLNRVVNRLDEGLDDPTRHQTSGMRVRTAVALKIAEGTIFKEFDQQGSGQTQNTVVSVQVVMPAGAPQQMREDTIGGVPSYVEGEVAHA